MRLDDLIKPIAPDAPCGEDLLALDDPDYCDYYFNVEDRLPTSYFNMVRGTLFDPKSVDQKAESANDRPTLGCIGTGSRWGAVGPSGSRRFDARRRIRPRPL